MAVALEKEVETYKKLLPELLNEQGKFALIHGEELAGVYETYDDALKIGYDKFGISYSFLVKKILASEQIQFFTRDLGTSCPV
ncbi:MAG: hypothetical protein HFP77_04010 [Methylococcales symbiont of Iophon sp. n. MRB-2018]|nr:MAG: hypothetical protein HFP77_04010 [Methylococcales symbiont of Iophon sp. n. MRB-2018]KAF3980131.1 MAG: hypothetical protein HFP76_03545 [Methylococcales symbiont of Iophon sp. n. MRB-2018]